MNNLLSLLTLFLFSANCFGQASERKEQFINAIIGTSFDSSLTPYYLLDDCLLLDDEVYVHAFPELRREVPDTVYRQLLKNIFGDTLRKKWDYKYLVHARRITKKRIDRISDKIRAEEDLHKLPTVYYVSRPIFDDRHEFALITIRCVGVVNDGCTYLYEKEVGKWIKISSAYCRLRTFCYGMKAKPTRRVK